MPKTIPPKATQSDKQKALPARTVPLTSPITDTSHSSLVLQRVQSGGNNPLQMKQDIIQLQQTIGNRAGQLR